MARGSDVVGAIVPVEALSELDARLDVALEQVGRWADAGTTPFRVQR